MELLEGQRAESNPPAMDELEAERSEWIAIAALGLARAYGDDEPE
jgi:hypothetical protein